MHSRDFVRAFGLMTVGGVSRVASSMGTERKLVALRRRLIDAQRGLIMQAADVEAVPPSNALRQIADLESAIVATETMIEEQREAAE